MRERGRDYYIDNPLARIERLERRVKALEEALVRANNSLMGIANASAGPPRVVVPQPEHGGLWELIMEEIDGVPRLIGQEL